VVKTKPFVVSKRDLRAVWMRGLVRPELWVGLGCIVLIITVLSLLRGSVTYGLVLGVLGVGFFLQYYARSMWHEVAASRRNGWFDQPRWLEFDDVTWTTHEADGTYIQQKLAGLLLKVERRASAYVLHFNSTPRTISLLPFAAFETEADRQAFERILARHQVPGLTVGPLPLESVDLPPGDSASTMSEAPAIIVTKAITFSREQLIELKLANGMTSLEQVAKFSLEALIAVFISTFIPSLIIFWILSSWLLRGLLAGAVVIPMTLWYYVVIANGFAYITERRAHVLRRQAGWYDPHWYEIDAEFLTRYQAGERDWRGRLDHIEKVIRFPGYLMLQLVSGAVIPLPTSAFQSESDLRHFEDRLRVSPADPPPPRTINLLFLKITWPRAS